mmetsp:Transcript_13711/g.19012  ORF Transcript_13711/g.19012 Transcript_13711/m.19012 type:complete len:1241 (+) Transcript_13711:3254-6976(+)|eukprot:CAMPEP_0184483248 /NCGR_PEP_ID=MMETSP0113_2-20130426/4891_1 /TAXON_ID=91329 /ORGANISM="Norrisiella sphaerica, Strain BC52" /LENGTH=1240 /DNA_ID=CAMNT_0026863529 /DNA_START=3198 /DNA_END=6920 /DNA_ORIENTATION=-
MPRQKIESRGLAGPLANMREALKINEAIMGSQRMSEAGTGVFMRNSTHLLDEEMLKQAHKFVEKRTQSVTELNELHHACARAKTRQAKRLIGYGYNVNKETPGGWTPLHFACKAASVDCAYLLIKSKAHVNAISTSGDTPLHVAASTGKALLVQLLLKHGADRLVEDDQGTLPINQVAASWILRKSKYHFTDFHDYAAVLDVLIGYGVGKCSNLERRAQLAALLVTDQMDAVHHVLARQIYLHVEMEVHSPKMSPSASPTARRFEQDAFRTSYRYDFEILLSNTSAEDEELRERKIKHEIALLERSENLTAVYSPRSAQSEGIQSMFKSPITRSPSQTAATKNKETSRSKEEKSTKSDIDKGDKDDTKLLEANEKVPAPLGQSKYNDDCAQVDLIGSKAGDKKRSLESQISSEKLPVPSDSSAASSTMIQNAVNALQRQQKIHAQIDLVKAPGTDVQPISRREGLRVVRKRHKYGNRGKAKGDTALKNLISEHKVDDLTNSHSKSQTRLLRQTSTSRIDGEYVSDTSPSPSGSPFCPSKRTSRPHGKIYSPSPRKQYRIRPVMLKRANTFDSSMNGSKLLGKHQLQHHNHYFAKNGIEREGVMNTNGEGRGDYDDDEHKQNIKPPALPLGFEEKISSLNSGDNAAGESKNSSEVVAQSPNGETQLVNDGDTPPSGQEQQGERKDDTASKNGRMRTSSAAQPRGLRQSQRQHDDEGKKQKKRDLKASAGGVSLLKASLSSNLVASPINNASRVVRSIGTASGDETPQQKQKRNGEGDSNATPVSKLSSTNMRGLRLMSGKGLGPQGFVLAALASGANHEDVLPSPAPNQSGHAKSPMGKDKNKSSIFTKHLDPMALMMENEKAVGLFTLPLVRAYFDVKWRGVRIAFWSLLAVQLLYVSILSFLALTIREDLKGTHITIETIALAITVSQAVMSVHVAFSMGIMRFLSYSLDWLQALLAFPTHIGHLSLLASVKGCPTLDGSSNVWILWFLAALNVVAWLNCLRVFLPFREKRNTIVSVFSMVRAFGIVVIVTFVIFIAAFSLLFFAMFRNSGATRLETAEQCFTELYFFAMGSMENYVEIVSEMDSEVKPGFQLMYMLFTAIMFIALGNWLIALMVSNYNSMRKHGEAMAEKWRAREVLILEGLLSPEERRGFGYTNVSKEDHDELRHNRRRGGSVGRLSPLQVEVERIHYGLEEKVDMLFRDVEELMKIAGIRSENEITHDAAVQWRADVNNWESLLRH